MSEDESEDVIPFNELAARYLEITRKNLANQRACAYMHKRIEVDAQARTLTCRDCGYVVDPFDYIAHWAMEGERRMTGLSGINVKIKIASAELVGLERRLDNVRASLKRSGNPQPHEELLQYRSDMLNGRVRVPMSPEIRTAISDAMKGKE